jgi:hypothetical protein
MKSPSALTTFQSRLAGQSQLRRHNRRHTTAQVVDDGRTEEEEEGASEDEVAPAEAVVGARGRWAMLRAQQERDAARIAKAGWGEAPRRRWLWRSEEAQEGISPAPPEVEPPAAATAAAAVTVAMVVVRAPPGPRRRAALPGERRGDGGGEPDGRAGLVGSFRNEPEP